VRRTARWWLYAGIVAAVVGLSLVHARSIAEPPYSYTGTFRFGWSILYIVLLAVTAYAFGLPDVPRTQKQAVASAAGAAAVGALSISVVQLFVGDALLPRFVVLGSALVLLPWYLICIAFAGGGVSTRPRDRVLVVSDSIDPAILRDDVGRNPERPAVVVEVAPLASVEADGSGRQPLFERAEHDRATVVVLDREAQASPSVVGQAASLHESGRRIRTLSLFYEEWLGMLPLAELERVSLMFDIGEVHRSRYSRLKRLLDVVFAAAGALVLVIVLPFVIAGNLAANRGSLFYRQVRVGKNGDHFEILKFRTMRSDAGAASPTEWTQERDPRITPFGAMLRKTHLDELPQVLNILRGDLSVVGPRPEQPQYVTELVEKLPFYNLRHLVRPGLTGWAQVKYGYAGDETDAIEKLQYDFYYLRHQRLTLDLRIIGRTIRSVLGAEGR
jgi:lipopolysaccharide/colanic/teichoic acid biosynthesis glycosyltransferase